MNSIRIGVAEKVDFHTMTSAMIKETLQKVLENPKYFENARQISTQFRDQKETPLARAVWWAEWLIRNPDCDYMRSPVLRVGYIVGNSYDVIAAICFGLFLALYIVMKLCSFIVRTFISKTPKEERSNKKAKKLN